MKQVKRLQTMIVWGDERLEKNGTSQIIIGGVSYGSLRYLKTGILLRVSELLKRRKEVISEKGTVPKSILEAFDSRIQQLLNWQNKAFYKGFDRQNCFSKRW